MRVHRHAALVTAIAVALPLATTLSAQAQQPGQRLSLDFADTPLGDVLRAVEGVGNVPHIALPDGVGDIRITISLRNATVTEALTSILGRAGLVAVGGGCAETARDDTRNWAEWARWRSQIAQVLPLPAAIQPAAKAPAATTERVYRIVVPNYRDLLGGELGNSYPEALSRVTRGCPCDPARLREGYECGLLRGTGVDPEGKLLAPLVNFNEFPKDEG